MQSGPPNGQDFEEARRWLQRGRKDPGTAAEAMAGLGSMEVIDADNPEAAREDGRALRKLAADRQPGDARVQRLLAEASQMVPQA